MSILSTPHTANGLPSPTLTNPDMILPNSSPSPRSSPPTPRQDQRLPSQPPIGTTGYVRSDSAPGEKARVKGAMYSPFRNGVLKQHDGSVRLRSGSERGGNRIAFENNRLSFRLDAAMPIASSPTLNEFSDQRIYTESTQGDFENGEGTYTTPAILEEDEDDPHSHAAMTRRAEWILANAKKRLTNMEGNLNRARSTLQARPSSSMSSYGDRSREPVSLYTIPGKGRSPGGSTPSKHRQANLPSLNEVHQGHSRVFSETSVPSSMQTGLPNGLSGKNGAVPTNGFGINGVDEATRDRHSEPSQNWFWNGLTRDISHRHANRPANGLQALSEDGPAISFEQQAVLEQVIEEEKGIDSESSDATAAFNAQNPPSAGLTRARSTTQMNELREQMQDLKGKISTLKRRARENNMRRRSLQSLRAPSPFTDAEQWYTASPRSEDRQRGDSSPKPLKDADSSFKAEKASNLTVQDSGNPSVAAEHNVANQVDERTLDENHPRGGLHGDKRVTEEISEGDTEIVNGLPSQKERLVLSDEPATAESIGLEDESPLVEESSTVDFEAREDSLYGDQDYHETSALPVVERHEDRPDAFDYEHFILSSALGSYSGVGIRRSSSRKKGANSLSSESSVETTKPRNSAGDIPQMDHPNNGGHGRQNSVDSVSTDNTFATANEDAHSIGSQDDGTFGHSRVGSRQAEPVRKHRANGSYVSAIDGLSSNAVQSNGSKKHIASAQKGYVNGVTRKAPVENGGLLQAPDLLTILSATNSWAEGAPPTGLKLGDRDKELVERLVKSLAKLCSQVHAWGPEGSVYEARVFRRKLDAARRVLDGEMNGEAF